MRTYLVVAHRTLVGDQLLQHLRSLAGEEECRFHLVVPVHHPSGAWSQGEVEAAARIRLAEGEAVLRDLGLAVSGEIGDANPVYAVSSALRSLDYDCDEVVISTLPPGRSRWLKMDAVSRLHRELDLPVTHLVGDPADARHGRRAARLRPPTAPR